MSRGVSSVLITIGFLALVALAIAPKPLTVIVHTETTMTETTNATTYNETTHNHNHAGPGAPPSRPE